MKNLLKKFHIGGSSGASSSTHAPAPAPVQSCATDHRRLDGSWTHVTGGAAELPSTRPVTGTLGNNTDEDQEMDYSLMEEEFQVQLALALSASSNTVDITGARGEIGGVHVESRQIGAATTMQDSGDAISRRYWVSAVLIFAHNSQDSNSGCLVSS